MTDSPSEPSDDAIQRAVLGCLLEFHPTRLSQAELLRELSADPDDFSRRDAIDIAVRDLIAAGLLRRDGDSIIPTRTLLRAEELRL